MTVAFAAYVCGLLPTLMLLGGLSDRIGRRVTITCAVLLSAIATVSLVLVPTWTTLVGARVVLGVATGLATTSGTAFMVEILGASKEKFAALLVTSATSLGFGGGALATGVSLALQGPTFFPISYLVFLCALPILTAIAVFLPPSSGSTSLPILRLPVFPKKTWIFGVALGLAWSSTGVVIAVIPLALRDIGLDGWAGTVIFLAIFVGFLCQPIAKRLSNERSLLIGFGLIPLGLAIVQIGITNANLTLILVGTSISSAASYGFTYLAALAEVSMRGQGERARAAAGLFVYAYFGFSLPVIATGILADAVEVSVAIRTYLFMLTMASAAAVLVWKFPKHATS